MNATNNGSSENAPVFNIKAVVTQTGLNPATIRAWERRYGLPNPDRSSGGHRQYSQRDIDTLKWLIARQNEGVSISHAVDLWQAYIDRGEDPLIPAASGFVKPEPAVALAFEGDQIEQLRDAWIDACLAFDRDQAEQVLATSFALFKPETVCIEVLQKGLVEVGNRWHTGQASVQQEHFTSELSLRRLEMLIAASPLPTRPERIIVATAPGEHHNFSALLLTFFLRQQGWDVVYLGADVPAEELVSTMDRVQPELIIVSVQLLQTAASLKEVATLAQSQGVPLAFGGLIFNQKPKLRRLIPGYFLGETLQEAVLQVPQLLKQRPPQQQVAEQAATYQRALAQFQERRALIESHVWGTFIATNRPTTHLSAINSDIAQTIEAALKLEDITVLNGDIAWIDYLLVSFRLPKELILDYVLAYYQAARIHLGESAGMVVEWLSQLISDNEAS